MRQLLKRTLLVVILGLVHSVVGGGSAHAFIRHLNPFGDAAVKVRVGMNVSAGLAQVVWQRKSDGACIKLNMGGAAGLADDFEIVGGGGADSIEIEVSTPAFPTTMCSYSLSRLPYNGHYVDLSGGGGNDALFAGNGDTYLSGQDGNDTLLFSGIGTLRGGNGNDTLIATGIGVSLDQLWGEGGNDCLEDRSAAAAVFDCGPGSDQYVTAFGVPITTNCETARTSFCPNPAP